MGHGPVLVKAPNWLTHLEYEWESPVWRHWWQELARDYTVIRFDQRGSGLSDWNVEDISFESWVNDLEAVVEATKVTHFALLGISQGGAVAVEYAVRHPEMVSKLILYGAYTRGSLRRGESPEVLEAMQTLMREGWGQDNPAYRMMFTSRFMPEATAEQMQWFNDLQRVSSSGENAARVQLVSSRVDILDRLPLITAPTLVMHALRDQGVSFNEGRQIAALIPDSHLVALDSGNHLTLEDEPAWAQLVANVRHFMAFNSPLPQSPEESAPRHLPAGLTQREVDVLRLIAAGKSNQDIAEELVISINTVTNHVKSILGKTQSANRTEAALFAFRHRLASPGT